MTIPSSPPILYPIIESSADLYRSVFSTAANERLSLNHLVPSLDRVDVRRKAYSVWWAYYMNTIYNSEIDGGYRRLVNNYLGDSNMIGDLAGLINPVQRVVDTYQLAFSGSFGKEIKLDEYLDDDQKQKIDSRVVDAVSQIWKWSNINREKEIICRYTPALGTCGLRIVAKNDPNPNNRRVYIKPEHPSRILDLTRDDRGNISEILFEYQIQEGILGTQKRVYTIREYMSKEKFASWRDSQPFDLVNNQPGGKFSEYANESGIVPYVMVTQNNIGGAFGLPAFIGHERQIDHINSLVAHINQQIHRHVSVTWFMEAGGPPPERIELGDMAVVYVQRELGQSTSAKIEPMVANLSLSEAISQVNLLQEELQNSLPELKASDGTFLSHQSGGTVSQLRLPAENRIMDARGSYEDALIQAQKIALSLGIFYEIPNFDLGTGTGTKSASDDAFQSGAEDHRFNVRPALPLSIDDRLTVAKSDAIVSGQTAGAGLGMGGGDNTNLPTKSPATTIPRTSSGVSSSTT